MSSISRRRFLGTSAAAPFGIGLASAANGQERPPTGHADLIITGGRVLTMDPENPVAEAVAVRGDRILAVGSSDDIDNLAGTGTQRIDARGMTVTPGFIDAHSHPILPWEALAVNVNLRQISAVQEVLAEKAKIADALVIAGFTPYSSLDARTKAFIERLYPLRHTHGFLAGKPGGAVITHAVPKDNDQLPPACQMGVNAIHFAMMEEGMNFVGAVTIQGNVPCVKCVLANECKMSGLKMLYGPDATKDSVGIKSFEDQPVTVATAKEIGRKIAEALDAK